jgi:hypothetical protein
MRLRRRRPAHLGTVLLILAQAMMPREASAAGPKPPTGTERVFGHVCEDPHLREIARPHRLPATGTARPGKRPRTLCGVGDFGFGRASFYLELAAGEIVWLYDAASADALTDLAPAVTLERGRDGRLTVGCSGCDARSVTLSEHGEGGLWLELAAGRVRVREFDGDRELAGTAGVPIKQRLFMTVATTRESCAGCSLMALAIYLPPDEARAWRQTVAGPGRRAIKGR